jgi:hypothetical protein
MSLGTTSTATIGRPTATTTTEATSTGATSQGARSCASRLEIDGSHCRSDKSGFLNEAKIVKRKTRTKGRAGREGKTERDR